MRVSDVYYSYKSKGKTLTPDQINELWKKAFREGKKEGKTEQENIKKNTR